MAYIDYVSLEEGSSALKALHERLAGPRGEVDNIVWIHGPNPAAMDHHVRVFVHERSRAEWVWQEILQRAVGIGLGGLALYGRHKRKQTRRRHPQYSKVVF